MIPVPEAVRKIAIWDAIDLAHVQVRASRHTFRQGSRAWENHDVATEKHPHTGRVLRTVRLAFAVNSLGMLWRSRASSAALDALFCLNGRTQTPKRIPRPLPWPSEEDRWFVALTEGRAHVNVLPSRK